MINQPDSKEVPGGYREVVIKSMRKTDTGVDMSFEGSVLSIVISNENLEKRFNIDPSSIVPGTTLFIKGRGNLGNSDVALARPDCLEDMKIAD